jgi:hypothetical protein
MMNKKKKMPPGLVKKMAKKTGKKVAKKGAKKKGYGR